MKRANSLREKQENVFTRGKGGGHPTQTNIQDTQALVGLLVIVQDTKGRGDVRVPIEE